jgi:hypothetical protein
MGVPMSGRRVHSAIVAFLLTTSFGCATRTPVPPTIIRWNSKALSPPFQADHRAILVTPGAAPQGVSRTVALHLAHDVVGDLTAIAAAESVGLEAGGGEPLTRSPITGRVTLDVARSTTTGPYRKLSGAPAWIVPFALWPTECPFIPASASQPPPTASDLELVIIPSADPRRVVVYHGAGSGRCYSRTHSVVAYDPPSAQGADMGDP